jgi:hypothetical protein
MRTPRPVVALLAATAVAVAACGDDQLTFESLAGEYQLVRIDGSAPPVEVRRTPERVEQITGGRLLLLDAGDYVMRVIFVVTQSGEVGPIQWDSTFIETGPFTIDGSLLAMQTTTEGVVMFGNVRGSTIVVGVPTIEGRPVLTFVR